MPCQQITNTGISYNPPLSSRSGPFATEADCLNACKEGACCNGTTCSVKPQCQCDAAAGEVFKGIGTVCSPNPCLICGCAENDDFPSEVLVEFSGFSFVYSPERSSDNGFLSDAATQIANFINSTTAIVPLVATSQSGVTYSTGGCRTNENQYQLFYGSTQQCDGCSPGFRSQYFPAGTFGTPGDYLLFSWGCAPTSGIIFPFVTFPADGRSIGLRTAVGCTPETPSRPWNTALSFFGCVFRFNGTIGPNLCDFASTAGQDFVLPYSSLSYGSWEVPGLASSEVGFSGVARYEIASGLITVRTSNPLP